MTDLVIKPSNSGGSVKLQTEGGTNGLTMASTGDLTTSGNVAVTGTVTGGTLGTGVTFPAGHMIFINSQSLAGQGNQGTKSSFFPTSKTDLNNSKSFYLIISASQHAPFSKIKIDYNAQFRSQISTNSVTEYRLIRWVGDVDVTSPTELTRGMVGDLGGSQSSEVNDVVSGSAIDDISSLSGQINYTLQYKTGSSGGSVYFGENSNFIMTISSIGII